MVQQICHPISLSLKTEILNCLLVLSKKLDCSEFIKISWHLVDLSVIMLLDLLDEDGVLRQYEIDCCTLSAETTSSTDSVNVVFLLVGKFVVDNEANLLDINTSCK